MEQHFPLEVIGNILSCVGSARDVVRASATSRKWQEAFRNHLHTLSFRSSDWQGYRNLSISELEIMITETIFQTTGLQCLQISMDGVNAFSASTVACWIVYTRGSLRELYYNVKTSPRSNVLEMCGRQKLEVLELSHDSIVGLEPDCLIFPCLKHLILRNVSISDCDLAIFLRSCPKLESLGLIDLEVEVVVSDDAVALLTVEINAPLLKRVLMEDVGFDKIVLEVDSIENLYLKDCAVEFIDVIGKGSLKHLTIDDVTALHLDIGDSVENLETVNISNFSIAWPKFYKMISKSAKLWKLRLWDVMFDDDSEVVDLDSIAASFPMLSHLSLCYHLKDELLPYGQRGSALLENVVFLRVGWSILSEVFADWVDGLLELCPNLRVLVVNGVVSDMKDHEECQMLGSFTTSIVRVMQKYPKVEVRFELL